MDPSVNTNQTMLLSSKDFVFSERTQHVVSSLGLVCSLFHVFFWFPSTFVDRLPRSPHRKPHKQHNHHLVPKPSYNTCIFWIVSNTDGFPIELITIFFQIKGCLSGKQKKKAKSSHQKAKAHTRKNTRQPTNQEHTRTLSSTNINKIPRCSP